MACGVPVISTNLVGIPDLIQNDETGLLVEPNDAAALADAIERISCNPDLASRLANNGRQIVLDKFNLDSCLDPLIQEFRKRSGLE